METVSRMYTMMEQNVHTRGVLSILDKQFDPSLDTFANIYIDFNVKLHLGRRFWQLTIEGEKGEYGDQVR